MRHILVTNALPYANGHLHLGHMLGYIQSDIWVRFQKMQGNTCHFVCGSDTHGTPIMLRAQKNNISPEQLVDGMIESHINDFADFDIAFDHYASTHKTLNQQIVNDIYQTLSQQDLIEQRTIEQAFDPKANMFLPDRFVTGTCPKCHTPEQYGDSCEACSATYSPMELINPTSAVTGQPPVKKQSLHYFFKLSQQADWLEQWLKNTADLQPEIRNKLKEWFADGLQDWDISRDAPYFGFPIPGTNEEKYFYVWLDAPIGYIASFQAYCEKHNIDFDHYWKSSQTSELYHFIGKDIIYFHALFWPAILQNAGYRKPTGIFANGFLTINGQKMSKSRGTFITARHYLDHLDSEYLRYYFAAKLTPRVDNLDLNFDDFTTRVNSDIVGKVINIASRCAGFLRKKFDNRLTDTVLDPELLKIFKNQKSVIAECYEKRDFAQAMRHIMKLADQANQFVDTYKPWQLIKSETDQSTLVHQVCSQAINLFKILMGYLTPVMPRLSKKAADFLNTTIDQWDTLDQWLGQHHTINRFKPLLTRIEPNKIEAIMNEKTTQPTLDDNQTTQTVDDNPLNIAPEASIDDVMKVDLRVAKITQATHVDGADKLLCLQLDLGQGVTKQVFAGIKKSYAPEDLVGQLTVMVANLKPRKMRFGLSEGMVLAASNDDNPGIYLLSPHQGAEPGMRIQ